MLFSPDVTAFAEQTDRVGHAPFKTATRMPAAIGPAVGGDSTAREDVGRPADAAFERSAEDDVGIDIPEAVHVAVREVARDAEAEVVRDEVVHAETTAEAVAVIAAMHGIRVAAEDVELELAGLEAGFRNGFEFLHLLASKAGGDEGEAREERKSQFLHFVFCVLGIVWFVSRVGTRMGARLFDLLVGGKRNFRAFFEARNILINNALNRGLETMQVMKIALGNFRLCWGRSLLESASLFPKNGSSIP